MFYTPIIVKYTPMKKVKLGFKPKNIGVYTLITTDLLTLGGCSTPTKGTNKTP